MKNSPEIDSQGIRSHRSSLVTHGSTRGRASASRRHLATLFLMHGRKRLRYLKNQALFLPASGPQEVRVFIAQTAWGLCVTATMNVLVLL